MMRILFQVFDRDDFDNAKDGSLLSGYIKKEDSQNKKYGVVELGKEKEDVDPRYLNSPTDYKLFRDCKIGLSKTEEEARSKKATFFKEFFMVRIFY